MRHEAIKLELIQWLTKLEDEETLAWLKVVKESSENNADWWNDLTEEQKSGIARGVNDVDAGRIYTHQDIKQKYGL